MSYKIVYHPQGEEDIAFLDNKRRKIVAEAIKNRLADEPEKYGRPLRGSLKGYWKLSVGDIRVVFKIVKNEVEILGVIHRKIVYEKIVKRL